MTFLVFSVFPAPDSPLLHIIEPLVSEPEKTRRSGREENERDENTLRLISMGQHILPSLLSYSVHMRRILIASPILVTCGRERPIEVFRFETNFHLRSRKTHFRSLSVYKWLKPCKDSPRLRIIRNKSITAGQRSSVLTPRSEGGRKRGPT